MRVLVVDDEAAARHSVTNALMRSGCSVLAAAEPRTVLDEFEAGQYDLVIMDADLGRIDGILFASQLQQFDVKLRVTIISGDPEDEARAKEEGFGFLLKPLAEKDLAALLARA